MVDPEGHPWDDDNHEAGDVDGHDEEGELPGEGQLHTEATVSTCQTEIHTLVKTSVGKHLRN